MKRWWVFVLVLGVMLAMAVPVGAVKPDCGKDPTHPSCKTPGEPAQGTTCTLASFDGVKDEASADSHMDSTDIQIGLTRDSWYYCVDVSDVREGDWIIDVAVTFGAVRELLIVLRESAGAGDPCWDEGIRERQLTAPSNADSPYVKSSPASVPNACGELYGDEDDPLALFVWMWAKGNSDPAVSVDVKLPLQLSTLPSP